MEYGHTEQPSAENKLQVQLHKFINASSAKSTRRSYQRDVRYFWTWAQYHSQLTADYPITTEVVLQFIVD